MISPKSIISRPPEKRFDTSMVIKADTLRTRIDDEVEKISPIASVVSISKVSSSSTIAEIVQSLVRYHRPHKTDWRGRFRLSAEGPSGFEDLPVQKNGGPIAKGASKYFCSKCKKDISEKVAKFCFHNKPKFGGRAYCFDCQIIYSILFQFF